MERLKYNIPKVAKLSMYSLYYHLGKTEQMKDPFTAIRSIKNDIKKPTLLMLNHLGRDTQPERFIRNNVEFNTFDLEYNGWGFRNEIDLTPMIKKFWTEQNESHQIWKK